ncbi:hypothetical protein BDB01DRAFT_346900 [Pilobolus umbonatus]|nr:hypothetical protein BDB01DRAFT_346900 [Pilobolus umbonatus]
MDDIKSIIQTNIRHIFLKPVYVEAVENLICCTDCIVRDLQDLKYQKLQSLEKTETRDIFHILKQFFHISTETFVNYNTIKEGGRTIECLDTIFSWITDVYFVDNQHELYASISDEWENLKERGSSEGIRHADVIHLADRVYQLIKRLQRYDTKKLHDAVTHIFEPYQGGFAPLQISLLHQALKSVFISQESKNPTLQMDYYTLLANIFPVICDEYGPMTIERIESDKVDGYQFILDDIKVDLSHVVPQMAHYTSGSFIQKVISMTMSDYFEYYFNTMSFTCDVYKYTYYKLKGFPLWSDTGSAKLLVNHMAITLRVKKTVLPNGEVVFSVMKCDCAIKDMDIQIANSHRHKFFNSMFNAPMKSSIEAALTHEISSFLHNSISTLFSIN